MKRLGIFGCTLACVGAFGTAWAATPPPPPVLPTPLSLTIAHAGNHLTVVVKCKHLKSNNAKQGLALDVRTTSPKGEYGVQSNGPGMPVAVHPYGGNGSTSGPARFTVSVKHQTVTYVFGLKAIRNPARVAIRALNQGMQHTKFYSLKL